MQTRLAQLSNTDTTQRTAELLWSTGARVVRQDAHSGEFYMEEVSLDPAHVRLGRLNNNAPLLNSHGRSNLSNILGVVEAGSAKTDGKLGTATVRFSKRADVEPIFRDVQDKIIKNVSVGFLVHLIERLPPDDKSEGLRIHRAVDWEPTEISLVTIGADAGACVRGDADLYEKYYPCKIIDRKGASMPNEYQNIGAGPAANPYENVKPSAAELHRVRTITDLCRQNQLPENFREELLVSGTSVQEVRQRVLDKLSQITERTPIRSGFGGAFVTDADLNPAHRRELIAEALAERHAGLKASDRARSFIGMGVVDIARMLMEERGERTTGLRPGEIITRTLTTSDLPELLTGAGNRVLRDAYMAHQSGIMAVFKQTTNDDFRARQVLATSEAPELLEVKQGAEYKYGAMAETKESYALATYGRIMGISRQGLINDDLGAFASMSRQYGQAASELVAKTLTELVHSNPTLAQSQAQVFSSTHLNLTTGTTAAAVNIDNIGVGVAAMRLQRGISGNIALGLGPKYLLVPASKEQLARQYTSQAYQPTEAGSVNPWAKELVPVVEPRLDALSTSAWYLFADPATFTCFEYAYLAGEEGPQIGFREGFNIDGVEFKVRLDLGAGAVEYRGAHKNAGA